MPGAVEATVVHDIAKGRVTIFAVNRADREIQLDAVLRGFDRLVVESQSILTGPDLAAYNTAADPYRVVPNPANGATDRGGAAGGPAAGPLLDRRPARRPGLTIRADVGDPSMSRGPRVSAARTPPDHAASRTRSGGPG